MTLRLRETFFQISFYARLIDLFLLGTFTLVFFPENLPKTSVSVKCSRYLFCLKYLKKYTVGHK